MRGKASGLLIICLAATSLIVFVTAAGVYQRSKTLTETLERLSQEMQEMEVSRTWKSGANTVTVTTVRGLAKPGQTVPPDETTEAWKARHNQDVAAALVEFPETIEPIQPIGK